MSIIDGVNGGGMPFPLDEAMDTEGSRRNRKRMFLMGVPWGAMYLPGLFPVDGYDETDEDPNP